MIGCVDMDAFFASVEQASNPFLRGKPVGVIGSKERTVVVTSSYEARRCGVKTGMSKYEALNICPDLILVVANNQKYIYISKLITEFISKISPKVEAYSIDEMFFDLSHINRENYKDVAYIIKSWVKERFQITCSVGIGISKLVAKMASGVNKPDGFYFVKEEDSIKFLDDFKLSDIWGIGKKMEQRFYSHGISSLKDIRRLGIEEMVRRFGKNGFHYYEMAYGRYEPIVYEEPPVKSIGHSMTLPFDIYSMEKLLPYILQLSEMVSARARNNMISGKTISAYVRYASMDKDGKMITIPYYTSATHHIYDIARDLFGSFNISNGIRLIGLSLSNLLHNSKSLVNLFDNPKMVNLYNAVDKINNRYGSWTIHHGSILNCLRFGSKTISPAWRPDGVRSIDVR
ncbi:MULTISPECIES: DNA polymerase Y family protein [Calditerrivibrio]|jgi:DNA polymerase-4|uniref:DNA polymerase Y family protein n=1 Tax=Calditerrivibrio TaxID=545865 RepID=UPI003C78B069